MDFTSPAVIYGVPCAAGLGWLIATLSGQRQRLAWMVVTASAYVSWFMSAKMAMELKHGASARTADAVSAMQLLELFLLIHFPIALCLAILGWQRWRAATPVVVPAPLMVKPAAREERLPVEV